VRYTIFQRGSLKLPEPKQEQLKRSRLIVFVVCGIVFYAIVSLGAIVALPSDQMIFTQHFPAVAGLPMVAGLSLLVILLLPLTYGRIEFKALGVSFKGAAGPVVLMAAMCFSDFGGDQGALVRGPQKDHSPDFHASLTFNP
jgi:uncharacterized membrane protein (DUF441 family)